MKYYFVTGSGRSGTTFLAHLLNGQPNYFIDHEYIGNRQFWLLTWYIGKPYSVPFLTKKKKEIEASHTVENFVDINGYLQNCTDEVEEIFKPQCILHIIRDPKMVIRSLYTRRSERAIHLLPKEEAEINRWLHEDKFYQVCWNWANCTRRLLEKKYPVIHFEKLISDYDYFKTHVAAPLGIEIDEATWNIRSKEKVKKTMPKWYRFLYSRVKGKEFLADEIPHHSMWTDDQKTIYNEVCGDLAKQLGYS
jgi:hypothetical protein